MAFSPTSSPEESTLRWASAPSSPELLLSPAAAAPSGYLARRAAAGARNKHGLTVEAPLSPLSQFAALLSPLLTTLLPTPTLPAFANGSSSPTASFAAAVERDKLAPPSSPRTLTRRLTGGTRIRTRTRARRLLLLAIIALAFGSVINNALQRLSWVWTRQRRKYQAAQATLGPGAAEYVRSGRHPIRRHIEQARSVWKTALRQQSTTAEAASKEYERRYRRKPPTGFEEWFAYAQENGVELPDEYDSLMASLEAFWALPPFELRRRTHELSVLPSFSLLRVTPRDVVALASPEWDATATQGRSIAQLLAPLIGRPGITPMAMAINEMEMPRVLVPWAEAERLADVLQYGALQLRVCYISHIDRYAGPNTSLAEPMWSLNWPSPLWNGRWRRLVCIRQNLRTRFASQAKSYDSQHWHAARPQYRIRSR